MRAHAPRRPLRQSTFQGSRLLSCVGVLLGGCNSARFVACPDFANPFSTIANKQWLVVSGRQWLVASLRDSRHRCQGDPFAKFTLERSERLGPSFDQVSTAPCER